VTDPLSSLFVALADRYTIEREIGRGGMATVYLAHDVKHGRPVAIKVLKPELSATLGSERFLREIQTAARLQHPHILALHDSGMVDGSLYYVMPYVDGESLRTRLDRERQLSLEETVRIARQVAGALGHAHSRNVVHRDIKPENILLSTAEDIANGGGISLIADFGIARAIAGDGETLTQTGMAVGTPSYMSPEQASGERGIDGRTDTYALGCVVYEMLAGHPPFLGATSQEILARHSLDPVPPLRTARPDLPEFVDRAVRRALAKSPADRFSTVTAFSAALSQSEPAPSNSRRVARPALLAVAAILAVVTALVAGYARLHAGSTPSIAVLAFNNVGGDSTNEPFSDGIAEELTTALGNIDGLSVTARTSAFSFKGKGLNVLEVGRRLGVRYIVEGRIRRAADRRRVGAQLIDVATGKEVWSGDFEHDALNRDVFTVQDSIARSIVHQLLPHLSRAAIASSLKRTTENPAAHELYVQGRYFFEKRSPEGLRKAQQYFEQAISKDSTYALAYAGLSDAYGHASVFGYASPNTNFPKAKFYASQALARDSTLAEAHASRGFIALFYEWDLATAQREFNLALTLGPRSPSAHLWHAWYFLATSKPNESIGEAQTAIDLDPFSLVNNTRLVSMLFYGRRFDAALVQGLKTVEMDPSFVGVRAELARVYVFLHRCPQALAELENTNAPPAAQLLGVPGYAYAKCGSRARALAEVDRLDAQAKSGAYVSHYGLAVIHSGLGNNDQAFAELEKAYLERAWSMFLLRLEPAFDDLRSDPRFAELLQKVSSGAAR
jgi:serine/threonine-protein kinase